MEIEVIPNRMTGKDIDAKVSTLRRSGCDGADDNEQALVAVKKDIDKIKKKLEME